MPYGVPCYRHHCKHNIRSSCSGWQPGDGSPVGPGTDCGFEPREERLINPGCCRHGCQMTATQYAQWNGHCAYQEPFWSPFFF